MNNDFWPEENKLMRERYKNGRPMQVFSEFIAIPGDGLPDGAIKKRLIFGLASGIAQSGAVIFSKEEHAHGVRHVATVILMAGREEEIE